MTKLSVNINSRKKLEEISSKPVYVFKQEVFKHELNGKVNKKMTNFTK